MFTLTKNIFTLTKNMGHEKHMVFLVRFFDWNEHFDQVLGHTSSEERQFFKMVHQDAHGLIKSTILNGHA